MNSSPVFTSCVSRFTIPRRFNQEWALGNSLPLLTTVRDRPNLDTPFDRMTARTQLNRSPPTMRTAGMGHHQAFLRPRLSARYRFSQGTLGDARHGRLAALRTPERGST